MVALIEEAGGLSNSSIPECRCQTEFGGTGVSVNGKEGPLFVLGQVKRPEQ